MFRYLLRLPDGEPPDPAVLVTAVPTWSVGDVITVGAGVQFRVVAIDDFPHAELVEQGSTACSPLSRHEMAAACTRRGGWWSFLDSCGSHHEKLR